MNPRARDVVGALTLTAILVGLIVILLVGNLPA